MAKTKPEVIQFLDYIEARPLAACQFMSEGKKKFKDLTRHGEDYGLQNLEEFQWKAIIRGATIELLNPQSKYNHLILKKITFALSSKKTVWGYVPKAIAEYNTRPDVSEMIPESKMVNALDTSNWYLTAPSVLEGSIALGVNNPAFLPEETREALRKNSAAKGKYQGAQAVSTHIVKPIIEQKQDLLAVVSDLNRQITQLSSPDGNFAKMISQNVISSLSQISNKNQEDDTVAA